MFKIPVRNLGAKVIALAVAIVLWVYVTNEQNPQTETTYNIPLEVRNLPETFMMTDVPETVKVKVRAPRNVLTGALPKEIKAYLDLKGLTEGKHGVKTQVYLPNGFDLIEVSPDKVNLELDVPGKRQVGVDVKVSGSPGSGIVLTRTAVKPAQIAIEGPKAILDNVDKAFVNVDVSGRTTDFYLDSPVFLIGRDGKKMENIRVSPEKVNVAITFGQEVAKRLTDIKPLIIQLPSGVGIKSITTDPEKIGISGAREAIEKVETIYTEPINLSNVTKDTVLEVKLQPKEGVILSQLTVHLNVRVGRD